ncbi:MAG: MBL fold metallo-hydrolase [Alteromonadaceae bacterium]|nr:MBL fold metallo-hydrolase [Alteromonadaceae bacterium]
MKKYRSIPCVTALCLTLVISMFSITSTAASSNEFDNVKINVIKARNNVYMLKGAGGNIGVLATDKGLIMIDDQFEPLAERIETAMQSISKQPIKYIINTHFHGDHTGSNGYFSHQAPIFAHQNVLERLLDEGKKAEFLPDITYQDGIVIHLADEEVQLTHYPSAHTDSDTAVYFKKANVLHTGDLFFELGFPYIDLKRGGSVKGYLSAVQTLLAQVPDDVVIIPGHGKLTDKKRYQAFADMIAYSIKRVSQLLNEGKTEQEIVILGLGDNYKQWSWQFINEEKWLKTVVADLSYH